MRLFAAEAVACGEVVAQLTLPDELVQEYQEPPDTSCTLTVPAADGVIVNATESILPGFDAFWL